MLQSPKQDQENENVIWTWIKNVLVNESDLEHNTVKYIFNWNNSDEIFWQKELAYNWKTWSTLEGQNEYFSKTCTKTPVFLA